MKIEEAIKRASDVSMTREEVIQQLSWWKELWESKKAECDKYENREYAWEKKYMLNCNIEVCKIALEALKQPEQKKAKFVQKEHWVALAWDCGPFSYELEDYNEETHSERRFYWHCSNCGKEASRNIKPTAKYCSECGAKMDKEEE